MAQTLDRQEQAAERGRGGIAGWAAGAAGLVAAALALGATELLSIIDGIPSLVLAIGDAVIDLVPPAVKDLAVAVLGTADKPALLVGIGVASLGLGWLLGLLARRAFVRGLAGLAVFAVLGVVAAAADPRAQLVGAVASGVVGAAAGALALQRLLARAPAAVRPAGPDDAGSGAGPRGGDEAAAESSTGPQGAAGSSSGGAAGPSPGGAAESSSGPQGTRRGFLRGAGALLGLALAGVLGGRWVRQARAVSLSRSSTVLPPVGEPLPPPPEAASLEIDGLAPLFTSNETFYRIDTALSVRQVDVSNWELQFAGMVDRPFTLSYDDLLGMEQVERDVTIACVSNEVGGGLVGNARWQGVPLPVLLERAGVQEGATQLVGRSVDGFTVGFPTAAALDGREALVAVAMNGEPLPAEHGYPARLIVAGLYGYVSATKWLSEIELTTLDAFDAYWIPRGWAKQAPIKTQSRIDVPGRGSVPAGSTVVAGVAWAPTRGISRVEVSVDDQSWVQAELAEGFDEDVWRQWRWTWDATPGSHTLRVRATDGEGVTQTEERNPPRPDGATGYHTVQVNVQG